MDYIIIFYLSIMYEVSEIDCQNIPKPEHEQQLRQDYQNIVILRGCILGFSAFLMLLNIFLICRKKQYGHTIIKYYLAIEILYFFALISVIFHNDFCNLGIFIKDNTIISQNQLVQCMIKLNRSYLTAIQGFINLSCYSIAYWLAINLALYIRINKQEELTDYNNNITKRIVGGILIILTWYLIPSIFTIIQDMPFSFGPTGYVYNDHYYYFYVGIINRHEEQENIGYKLLIIFWMFFIPISSLIYQIRFIFCKKDVTSHKSQDFSQLQSESQFLRNESIGVSRFFFFVQIFNVTKFILALFETLWQLVLVFNIIYDLLAVVLLLLWYKNYRNKGKNKQTLIIKRIFIAKTKLILIKPYFYNLSKLSYYNDCHYILISLSIFWTQNIIMQTLTIKECQQKFDPSNNPDDHDYQVVRIIRICIIVISSVALLINLALIIKKKQYKFTTIKLFMYVQICYLVSLISVLPHDPSFNLGIFRKQNYPLFLHDLTQCMVVQGGQTQLAFIGLINYGCYTISYWFAICITMYIKLILENNNKSFLRKKSLMIFSVLVVIIVWYLTAFFLTFCTNVPFSFGPSGYQYGDYYYFFSPGIVNRYEGTDFQSLGTGLTILWMYFWLISLFIYHCYLLCTNRRLTKERQELNDLTSRQEFLIKSGRLGLYIFIVQIILVTKSFVLLLSQNIQWHVVFIINILFDLLGLLLLVIYLVYFYHQGVNLQFQSLIKDKSLLQAFNDYSTSHLI